MLYLLLLSFGTVTILHYYRPQQSCGKVMFLHLCVILFTGVISVPACTTGHMTMRGLCPGGSLSRRSLSRGVCHSVHMGGSLSQHAPQVIWPWGESVRGEESLSRRSLSGGSLSRDLCLGGLCLGISVWGSLSRGSLSRGASVQGGSVRDTPLYGNEQAVRILLECILVFIFRCGVNTASIFKHLPNHICLKTLPEP